jgi:hypothetical protein
VLDLPAIGIAGTRRLDRRGPIDDLGIVSHAPTMTAGTRGGKGPLASIFAWTLDMCVATASPAPDELSRDQRS